MGSSSGPSTRKRRGTLYADSRARRSWRTLFEVGDLVRFGEDDRADDLAPLGVGETEHEAHRDTPVTSRQRGLDLAGTRWRPRS